MSRYGVKVDKSTSSRSPNAPKSVTTVKSVKKAKPQESDDEYDSIEEAESNDVESIMSDEDVEEDVNDDDNNSDDEEPDEKPTKTSVKPSNKSSNTSKSTKIKDADDSDGDDAHVVPTKSMFKPTVKPIVKPVIKPMAKLDNKVTKTASKTVVKASTSKKVVKHESDDEVEENEEESEVDEIDNEEEEEDVVPKKKVLQPVKKNVKPVTVSTSKSPVVAKPSTKVIVKPAPVEMDAYEKANLNTEKYKKAKRLLKANFGHDNFKPYQYKIIDGIVSGKDVVAVMPTGYGKSLCFQMPPLITGEVAIVISPLIALMADQKMILDKLGMSSCCYNSTLSQKKKKEVEDGLVNGAYHILYITPESLVSCSKLIDRIYESQGICMIAIDEAHCLSSYGFDFRPKYREIVNTRKILRGVPVLAVTATATDKVIADIQTVMEMKNHDLIKTSFDRPNLTINVKMYSQNTLDQIVKILQDADGPAIVYCLTKNDTETMAESLRVAGVEAKAYHSGLNKNERFETQEQFMNGEYRCITATIAFGMGINKPDIRTVIHYGCPQNIESYYQEIGRAGRDGKESSCYLFYKQKDFIIQQRFINEIKDARYKQVRNNLLQVISSYVNTNSCRRKYILNYFGQKTDDITCGKCDNCNVVQQKVSKKDEHKLFQVLSTVLTIQVTKGYSFGMSTLVLILKGSSAQKVQKWMKDLAYFGSMKNDPVKQVNEFIHKAVELGYLEDHDVGGCVRVLRCTDYGIKFGQEYEEKLNKMIKNRDMDIDKLVLE
ncbi:ATP-dependent helicase homolog [Yasminevirus sp. GU-2018]|uniref:ATP-dependent helicase homolog n=1 Tax=Yasminevirus sp. GU-2018 TaxID=2420051 RepID=A0A5K0UBZ1_9VIRU|nr:ATP-dependent helicase homolog [Yasminevirus sp. GU-2018]